MLNFRPIEKHRHHHAALIHLYMIQCPQHQINMQLLRVSPVLLCQPFLWKTLPHSPQTFFHGCMVRPHCPIISSVSFRITALQRFLIFHLDNLEFVSFYTKLFGVFYHTIHFPKVFIYFISHKIFP